MEEIPGSALMELSPSHAIFVKEIDQQSQELVDIVRNTNTSDYQGRDLYACRYRLSTFCNMLRLVEVSDNSETFTITSLLTKDSCQFLTLEGMITDERLAELISPINTVCQSFGDHARETKPAWEIIILALRTCLERLVEINRRQISDKFLDEEISEHEVFAILSTSHTILQMLEEHSIYPGWSDDDREKIIYSLKSAIDSISLLASSWSEVDSVRSHTNRILTFLASQ